MPSREGEVVSKFGRPDREWKNADGTRVLMYDDMWGYANRRYVVDPDHNVVAGGLVVNEDTFARLQPGMTQEEVQRELGRPGETAGYPRLNEQVWSWRYVEFGNRHMFFNAHFDASSGRLKTTSRTEEQRHPRFGIGIGLGF